MILSKGGKKERYFISMTILLYSHLLHSHNIYVDGFLNPPSSSLSSSSSSSSELFCKANNDNWSGFNQEWAGYPISQLDNIRNSVKSAATAATVASTIGLGSSKRVLATTNTDISSTLTTAAVSETSIPAFNEAYTGKRIHVYMYMYIYIYIYMYL